MTEKRLKECLKAEQLKVGGTQTKQVRRAKLLNHALASNLSNTTTKALIDTMNNAGILIELKRLSLDTGGNARIRKDRLFSALTGKIPPELTVTGTCTPKDEQKPVLPPTQSDKVDTSPGLQELKWNELALPQMESILEHYIDNFKPTSSPEKPGNNNRLKAMLIRSSTFRSQVGHTPNT